MNPGTHFADLTQEEQDIFHNSFTKDLQDLKANEAINPLFCDLFVSVCKSPSFSIFTDKEAQNIVQLNDPHSKREAVLKYAEEKRPSALVVFYYLLHLKDKTAYENLPSCKENDQKMALISNRDTSLTVLEKQVEEISHTLSKPPPDEKITTLMKDISLPSLGKQIEELLQTSFKPPSPRPAKPIAPIAPTRPHKSRKNDETDDSVVAKEKKLDKENDEEKESSDNDTGPAKPIAPIAPTRPHKSRKNDETDDSVEAKEKRLEETDDEDKKLLTNDTEEETIDGIQDKKKKPPAKVSVRNGKENWMKLSRNWEKSKRDIFFHFIILCFAVGIVLVLHYKFSDWTVSAGAGLISFAILEAIGIYFDFVNRVRTIIRAALKVVFQIFPSLGKNKPLSFMSKSTEKLK